MLVASSRKGNQITAARAKLANGNHWLVHYAEPVACDILLKENRVSYQNSAFKKDIADRLVDAACAKHTLGK